MGRSSSVRIGFKYYLGMHMVICHGPVDAVTGIIVGERTAWTGNVTTNQGIFIDKPDLFGGEKKEGGIKGTVDILLGGSTQARNSYLQARLGTDIPAFRGVVSLVLRHVYVTAMTRYPKPWAVRAQRAAAKSWYPEKASIVASGDIPANSTPGSHIIYEAITNPDWGMGLNIATIDDTAFRAAADILYAEGFGLSMPFVKQTTVQEFIQTVISHIGAMLYTDRVTGKYVLTLIRKPDAQELTDAIEFNESNIISHSSFERPSPAEIINEIIIVFREQGAIKNKSITLQNMALIESEGVVSQTVNYPGIDNDTTAGRIGERDLGQFGTPLAQVSVSVGRLGWAVKPGDVVKYNNPRLGVSGMVLRVFSIDYGTLVDGAITLDCTEDIFNLPATSYLSTQGSEWVEPVQAPVASPHTNMFEIPYYEIANNYTAGEAETFDSTTAILQVAAEVPASASADFQMWTSSTDVVGNYRFGFSGSYTPTLTLSAALPKPATLALSNAVTVAFSVGSGVYFDFPIGNYCYLGNELVELVALDTTGSTVTLKRGCLDTIPEAHLSGAKLYMMEGFDSQSLVNYIGDPVTNTGDLVYGRVLTQTDVGLLPIADATTVSVQMVGRQFKPLPPHAVLISSLYYPASQALTVLGASVTWRSRQRSLQITKPFNSYFNTAGNNLNSSYRFVMRVLNENNELIWRRDTFGKTNANNFAESMSSSVERYMGGRTLVGNQVIITSTGGFVSPYHASFASGNTDHRSRPSVPVIGAQKVYVEITTDDSDNFYIGVCNDHGAYRAVDVLNTALLNVATNTLSGAITGTEGTGALHNGTCGIAMDVVNKKLWLRNTNGTWRDGDPATGTGGLDWSTLLSTDPTNMRTYFYPMIANEFTTATITATSIDWNLGATAFAHTIPTGFVAYELPVVAVTTLDPSRVGTGNSIINGNLTAKFDSNSLYKVFGGTTMQANTGRFYWDVRILRLDDVGVSENIFIGFGSDALLVTSAPTGVGALYITQDGKVSIHGAAAVLCDELPAGFTTFEENDSIGFGLDTFSGKVEVFLNGNKINSLPYQVTLATNTAPMVACRNAAADVRFNFKMLPTNTIAGRFSASARYSFGTVADFYRTFDINQIGVNSDVGEPELTVQLHTEETRTETGGIATETNPDMVVSSLQTFEHTWTRTFT